MERIDLRPAAKAKRERKNAARSHLHAEIKPTNHAGAEEVRAIWRRELKKQRTAKVFDGSAKAAKERHRIDRSGKPRKPQVARKLVAATPFDHIHPRHKREAMRAAL